MIRVNVRLVEWEVRLKMDYRIIDIESGTVLTKGHSVQVAIDIAKNEMCFATPDILRHKLERRMALKAQECTA
jgi:acyl-CoA thioester hydrolase